MSGDEPVEVYTVNNPMVAELIRNALEAEGIVCEISGESQGGFSGVLDEIQIMTHAGDAERARQIISELELNHAQSTDSSEDDDEPETGIMEQKS